MNCTSMYSTHSSSTISSVLPRTSQYCHTVHMYALVLHLPTSPASSRTQSFTSCGVHAHYIHFTSTYFQSAFVTCSPLAHLNHSFQRLPLNQLGNLAFTGVKTSHTTVKMSDTQQCVGVAIRCRRTNERTNERTLTVAPLRSRSSLRLRSLS